MKQRNVQLELIRQITFWSLFIVSAFLSVNLYIGLVQGIYNRGIMIFVAVALEGLKILCLTMANTARWQSGQYRLQYVKESMMGMFRWYKRKSIRDSGLLRAAIDTKKQNRKAFGLYFAYVLTAFLSISASFGYVLETVDKATTHALVTTHSDAISIYRQSQDQIDSQIKQNQSTITDYNKYIDSLDLLSDTYQKDRDKYQKLIDTLQQKNTQLLDKKLSINDSIQNLSLADITTQKTVDKTMYQLMGEVLLIPDKTIMFILLYMLSILIEIGIFITSPHFHKEEVDDMVPSFTPRKKMKTTTLEPSNYGDTPSPETSEKDSVETPSQSLSDILKEVKEKVEPLNDHVTLNIEEEVKEAPKEEDNVRLTPSSTSRFIDALFNNDGKTYLKDKFEAAAAIGIPKIEAINIFEYLKRTKINGYPLVEFRKETEKWYPNHTSEVIKHHLESNYRK